MTTRSRDARDLLARRLIAKVAGWVGTIGRSGVPLSMRARRFLAKQMDYYSEHGLKSNGRF